VASPPGQGAGQPAGRWELLRALGSMATDSPADTERLAGALGLPAWTPAEHTELFVLSLPPYASVHLGAEGKLGGEAADRVAGIWRALGLSPPADADHLGPILALYAELGEAAATASQPATRERLDRAREAVLWEHLWPWVPGYLDAVTSQAGVARPWAALAQRALRAEVRFSKPPADLPLALRAAPEPLSPLATLDELLDAITARVRSGFILTRSDLAAAAGRLGLGLRHGERRFALRAMLEQDPGATLSWLAGHAWCWSALQRRHVAVPADPNRWWCDRAATSARSLQDLAAIAIGVAPSGGSSG
jgi:TorA maturation chaperone TorD